MADHFDTWDLDSVIRSCCSDNNNDDIIGGGYGGCYYPSYSYSTTTCYESIQQADDLLLNSDFPDYSSVNLDDLEEIYKPFYSLLHQPPFPDTATAASSPQPQPAPACIASRDVDQEQELSSSSAQKNKLETQGSLSASDLTTASTSAASTRPAKRKQQKRVVQHLTAEGLSADKWAWRKYGQKPIKGSPYPRSYYRCSSSKGCPARKQLEQNSSDPNMFIVAYRAEHNHAQPTRRSSLSGITRNKLSSSAKNKIHNQATASISGRTSSTTSTTPQSSSSSPASSRGVVVVEDEEITNKLLVEEADDGFMLFQDGGDDDFFKGLEEFDGMAFDDGSSLLDQVVSTGTGSFGFPHWIDERSSSGPSSASASYNSYTNMAYVM